MPYISLIRFSPSHIHTNHIKTWTNCMIMCQTSAPFFRLLYWHKYTKETFFNLYIWSRRETASQVVFLIPKIMHGAVNKSFGKVLKTKPDGWKQFTKEHILHEKLGHCRGFHLLTSYRAQLVSLSSLAILSLSLVCLRCNEVVQTFWLVTVGKAHVLLKALTRSLFNSSVPVSHESVTVSSKQGHRNCCS